MDDDEFPQSTPGPALAKLRRQVGLSQEALAVEIGITRSNVALWEKKPSLDAIRSHRYRRALRAKAAELTGEIAPKSA